MTNPSSPEANALGEHCEEIVRRFLLTAVVVDDELSAPAETPVHGGLTPPDQRASSQAPAQAAPQHGPSRPLKVDPITLSFARQGMVCGVVLPPRDQDDLEALVKAIARADIVILDWRLSRTSGATALPLLKRILRADQPARLRLIAFYTGEPDRQDIRRRISERLNDLDAPHGTTRTTDDHGRIDFGACRIVVYGKPGSGADALNTVVNEEELAERLIADVAEMAQGLLPSLVLTALAAVRENVYRVLEHFGPDLDPAFLAHRACLPQPSDSEQHMVGQIASELRGIMDDAVDKTCPAGIDAIKHWLSDRFADDHVEFFEDRKAKVPEVLNMLTEGLEKKPPACLGKKKWNLISHGLARSSADDLVPSRARNGLPALPIASSALPLALPAWL